MPLRFTDLNLFKKTTLFANIDTYTITIIADFNDFSVNLIRSPAVVTSISCLLISYSPIAFVINRLKTYKI